MPETTVEPAGDRAPGRPVEIVGHRGAAAYAHGNTRAAFHAALAAGVDRVEFDVLGHHGTLLLAHDHCDLERPDVLTVDEGLELLAAAGVPLSCDVKTWGHEREIADALNRHEVSARTIVCGHDARALRRIADRAEGAKVGWSVPQTADTPAITVPGPVDAALAAGWLRRLPGHVAPMLLDGRIDGVMCEHRLVSPTLVDAVHDAGGFLVAWTVDDPAVARRLARLRVDAITTNAPREIAKAVRDCGHAAA